MGLASEVLKLAQNVDAGSDLLSNKSQTYEVLVRTEALCIVLLPKNGADDISAIINYNSTPSSTSNNHSVFLCVLVKDHTLNVDL